MRRSGGLGNSGRKGHEKRKEEGEEGDVEGSAKSPLARRGVCYRTSYLPPSPPPPPSPTVAVAAVIYRPYLKPANCLFKHNKTAVPPFNLRGSLFRVRGPCRLPPKAPPSHHPKPASRGLTPAAGARGRTELLPSPTSSTPLASPRPFSNTLRPASRSSWRRHRRLPFAPYAGI